MNTWASCVEEFHRQRGEVVPTRPCIPTATVVALRQRLMLEELAELAAALAGRDIVAVADGIADLLYVTVGTATACGLGPILEQLFLEVHRSNLTKIVRGDTLPEGGKYGLSGSRPPGYRAPLLGVIIDTYDDAVKSIEESCLEGKK